MKYVIDVDRLTASLTVLCIAVAFFLIGWILIIITAKILQKMLGKTKVDKSLHTFIINAIKAVLFIILIITILQHMGVRTSSLLAFIGAGGAAIALALKDSLGNIAGGFIILINKTFKCGDEISVSGSIQTTGIVDEIDLLFTKMHSWDNKTITVPNGLMITSVLTNFTESGIRRVDKVYQVAKDTDIAKLKQILLKVAKDNPFTMDKPEPVIGISAIGGQAISIDLKVWCKADDYYAAAYKIEEDASEALKNADIELTYRKIDIHMQ